MGREILKWLAALATGAASAAAAYISSNTGTGPAATDPLIALVVVTALTKLVAWLTSKIPAKPAA